MNIEITTLESYLKNILKKGHSLLRCQSGHVFLFDGATEQLDTVAKFSELPLQIEDKAIIEFTQEARKTGDLLIWSADETKPSFTKSLQICNSPDVHKAVAMPVILHQRPVIVFSFFFYNTNESDSVDASSMDEVNGSEEERIHKLWRYLNQPDVLNSIWEKFYMKIEAQINEAASAPSYLRHKLDKFITDLKQDFDTARKPQPDMLYVQLVDRQQKMIRTIRGYGAPLSFEYLPPHTIQSNDIQANIVSSGRPEIIAGFDKDRFDKGVCKQYEHERFVRIWVPLIPFHPQNQLLGDLTIDEYLSNTLYWNEKKLSNDGRMLQMDSDWINESRPPSSLIFGTVEFGYKRQTMESLDLAPWTEDLAIWVMARVYEKSWSLFESTLDGSIEKVGRALSLLGFGDRVCFSLKRSQKKLLEVRQYPIENAFRIAIPELWPNTAESKDQSHGYSSGSQSNIQVEVISPSDGIALNTLPTYYIDNIVRMAKIKAAPALDISAHLFRGTLYPQELVVSYTDPSYVGTLINDPVVKSVCMEAVALTDAIACLAYLFTEKPFVKEDREAQPNPIELRPPTICVDKDNGAKEICGKNNERLHELALKVVKERIPVYLNTEETGLDDIKCILLPLEISNLITGALILIFNRDKEFLDREKLDIERRVPRWVYRIHMDQLIMRQRFAALISELQREISELRTKYIKEANAKFSKSSFIEMTLKKILEIFNVNIAWLTLHTDPGFSPLQIFRHWIVKKSSSLVSGQHAFVDVAFSGPCKEACEKKEPMVSSGSDITKQINPIINMLDEETQNLIPMGKQVNSLNNFSKSLKGITTNATMLTFPLIGYETGESQSNAACTIMLPDVHYYDEKHSIYLIRLGRFLAEMLEQVRQEEHKLLVSDLNCALTNLSLYYARDAKTIDDIYGFFLRTLATDNETYNSTCLQGEDRNLMMSDHVTVWNVMHDEKKLIARSGRGTALKAIQNARIEIIDLKVHPLFANRSLLADQGDYSKIRRNNPILLTRSLSGGPKSKAGKLVIEAYQKTGQWRWLVSFPLLDTEYNVYGVVDCLRSDPLPQPQEAVMEQILPRATAQFSIAINYRRFKTLADVTKILFEDIQKMLRQFRIHEAYRELARGIAEAFHCEHCDLFLPHSDDMLLVATTRIKTPLSDSQRSKYWMKLDDTSQEIYGASLQSGRTRIGRKAFAKRKARSHRDNHLSPELQKLLGLDKPSEYLITTFRETDKVSLNEKRESIIVGLVCIQGPKPRLKDSDDIVKESDQSFLKKTLLFNDDDYWLADELSPAIQRIVRMVQLVEEQALLVTEASHSLGQPLQVLRSAIANPFRMLADLMKDEYGKSVTSVREMMEEIDWSFKFVENARQQLSYLTRSRGPDQTYKFEKTNLHKLINECYTFMNRLAMMQGNRIDYSQGDRIKLISLEPQYIRNAIINLLDNACKYSWRLRPIQIVVTENNGVVSISVKNWGVGIPKDHTKRIFDLWFRSDIQDSKGVRPGTGIGLAIVKEAIEDIHGGEVFCESHPVKESSFTEDKVDNMEHETTFTIEISRDKLENLSEERRTYE